MSEKLQHNSTEAIYVPEPDPMVLGPDSIWRRQSTGETISQEMSQQTGPTPAQLVAEEHKQVAETDYTKEEREKIDQYRDLIRDVKTTNNVSGTAAALHHYGSVAEIVLRPQQESTEEATRHDAVFGTGISERLYRSKSDQFNSTVEGVRKILDMLSRWST